MDNITTQTFCTSCGSKLNSEAAFCTNCGAKVQQVNEEPKKQFCTNCGKEIEEGQRFCIVCGQKVAEEVVQMQEPPIASAPKKSSKLWIILLAAGVTTILVFILAFFGIKEMQRQDLHDKLAYTDWYTYDGTLKKTLYFSEGIIEYDAHFTYIGKQNIATYTYEVIDGDTIAIDGEEIDVDIGGDSATFSPSFIDSDSYSFWVKD